MIEVDQEDQATHLTRRGRQARHFTTNVPKSLDLKSSSEQIFSENRRWVPLIIPLQDEGCPSYFSSQLGSEKTVLTAMIRTRRTALAPQRWQRLFRESMKWPWIRRNCREWTDRLVSTLDEIFLRTYWRYSNRRSCWRCTDRCVWHVTWRWADSRSSWDCVVFFWWNLRPNRFTERHSSPCPAMILTCESYCRLRWW